MDTPLTHTQQSTKCLHKNFFIFHPAGRISNSDCFVNSFIMVVGESIFYWIRFRQEYRIACSVLASVQQESSHVWTLEAYRPLRGKCSLCCSVLGGGVPQSWLGVPQSCHGWGYPSPDMAGGSRILEYPQLRLGTPQDWSTRPERTWNRWPGKEPGTGVPLERTWDQWPGKEPGTVVLLPRKDLGKNMGLGYPLGVDWQSNWKYYLPPSFGCGR